MTTLLLTCAGAGERAGFHYNKLLANLDGSTPFEKNLSAFIESEIIDQYVITCRENDRDIFEQKAKALGIDPIFVIGGSTRSQSVKLGLEKVTGEIVLIHDGARPFVSKDTICDCALKAKEFGSAIAAIPSTDTIATVEGEYITSSTREGLYSVQTPQAFNTEQIKKAFELAGDEQFTDESGLYAKYIGKCALAKGSPENKKLTYMGDFTVGGGNALCGTGFDLHVFAEDRKLILGGVEVPYKKGLLGHSDADVLTHAIMDALLSSAGLKDIGCYFPDTDPKYKGISSMKLLEEVMKLIKKSGYKPINVSAVIMAQKPKLAPFTDQMRQNLAQAIGITKDKMGISCTTLEGIGIVGREEGIATQAYCMIQKI